MFIIIGFIEIAMNLLYNTKFEYNRPRPTLKALKCVKQCYMYSTLHS